ncbi:MAG: hypothetical protein NTV61_11490 [Candidatus Bathyarchaeota archaeon]|nr:hypothetical protein [Candidatus Bathyarchaeota archaeon]
MLQLENPGYILRISRDEWLEQVFRLNKYYTGIMRDYKRGTPILLAMKAGGRDSFVGYGIVDKVEMLWGITYKSVVYFFSKCSERKEKNLLL